jgi:hypothetical protein
MELTQHLPRKHSRVNESHAEEQKQMRAMKNKNKNNDGSGHLPVRILLTGKVNCPTKSLALVWS